MGVAHDVIAVSLTTSKGKHLPNVEYESVAFLSIVEYEIVTYLSMVCQ
jgi:hypothetical protein